MEDLLRAVICPNIGADQEPPRNTNTVFVLNQGVAFEDTYKPVVDTHISTYGVTKHTAPAVVKKFFTR